MIPSPRDARSVIAGVFIVAAVGTIAGRVPTALAINGASLALAKSSGDQRWTIDSGWTTREPRVATASPLDTPRGVDVATAGAANAKVPTTRGRSYAARVRDDRTAYARDVAALAALGAARPWEAVGLVRIDEESGRHLQAVEDARRTGAVGDLLNVAAVALTAGRIEDARRAAELAHEARPEALASAVMLGHILATYPTDAGAIRRAIDLLGPAAQSDPLNGAIFMDLAHALAMVHRNEEAMTYLAVAAARRPGDPAVPLVRGDIYLDWGNLEAAARQYGAALELDPRQKWALLGLGRVYLAERRRADALAVLQRALKIDPSFEPAFTLIGSVK